MTRPIYIVSIRRIDCTLPVVLQDLEIFKSEVYLSAEDYSELSKLTEQDEKDLYVNDTLVNRVDQIQRIALGTLTVDEGEEQQ